MIDSITFSNYKLFKSQQTLKIKPITVLIGKNNSGKSALLKLPVIISQSLKGEPLKWSYQLSNSNIDTIQLGRAFRDLIYNKNETQSLYVKFEKENNTIEFSYLDKEGFLDLKKDNLQVNNFQAYKTLASIPNKEIFDFDVDYLAGIREEPEYDYVYNKEHYTNVGIKGQNTYPILIEDFIDSGQLLTKVSRWFEDNFEGWKLDIIKNEKQTVTDYEIVIKNSHINAINLKQTGQGIQQVLPLIVRSFLITTTSQLNIIEEPETHLHPAAHGNLAERFVESYNENTNIKYLIETHSENFILRLRALIANKKLEANNLVIYFVDYNQEKKECTLREIEIDELGNIKNDDWPNGIFTESLDEISKIIDGQNSQDSL
jgi:predicted ATPase